MREGTTKVNFGSSISQTAPTPVRRGQGVYLDNAGHLLELFQAWTPDQAAQQRILVTNPAKLYGFPN